LQKVEMAATTTLGSNLTKIATTSLAKVGLTGLVSVELFASDSEFPKFGRPPAVTREIGRL
jgi:hypothetical protein